ncbi:MAG: ATP-binding protein, partial [Deltaproteobacteria bacterium]|nr:ATP-binding protein [Deltaproteobacteria bacterium]
MKIEDYEKLGAFYLGRPVDAETGEDLPGPLLYDSKDLTTHAVIVGMTGSGKTGLAISLLEEALIDGVPVLAIDPKGDLGNLLLTFPELRAEDFRPWIDEGAATRAGQTPEAFAASQARFWREGLASWGQGPERLSRLEAAAERVIYTPGSEAGRPLSILRSLDAPPPATLEDEEAFRERILSSVAGLLGLLGIEADPLQSREHILLSTLIERAWREGRNLDMASLIHQIQNPPIERVGILELETFYPADERFALAMRMNSLLASPAFAAWREGEPMDIGRMLRASDGRPRLSIVSIAHLSDHERMFVVTMLLGQLVSWTRAQSGSQSLRAILYMDEVFGYLPPTANPPSKTPMLTLLKQARAYGVGVVLATQNPVDLDYKALSNCGTWLLGRLQTERDKARVIDGLESAAGSAAANLDRKALERTLSRLESRVFLMNNVHEDEPVLLRSRWALSYLAGPLSRAQIGRLSTERAAPASAAERGQTTA